MGGGRGGLNALKTQHSLDPSMFRTFKQGSVLRPGWRRPTRSTTGPESTKKGRAGCHMVPGVRTGRRCPQPRNNYIAGYEKDEVKPRLMRPRKSRGRYADRQLPKIAVTDGSRPTTDGGRLRRREGDVGGGRRRFYCSRKFDNLDLFMFRTVKPASTSFDLGGGHVVETLRARPQQRRHGCTS